MEKGVVNWVEPLKKFESRCEEWSKTWIPTFFRPFFQGFCFEYLMTCLKYYLPKISDDDDDGNDDVDDDDDFC